MEIFLSYFGGKVGLVGRSGVNNAQLEEISIISGEYPGFNRGIANFTEDFWFGSG